MKHIWLKINEVLSSDSSNLLQSLVFFSAGFSLYQLFLLGNWRLLYLVPISFVFKEFVVSGYYHRCISHNAWECPKWLEVIFLILGAGFGLGATIGWAAVHREHHDTADIVGVDPHGPTRSLWENITVFRRKPDQKYMEQLWRNPRLRIQGQFYWSIFFVVASLLIMTIGLAEYFFMLFMIYFQLISLNIIGHMPKLIDKMVVFGADINHEMHHDKPWKANTNKFDIAYYTLIKWFPHN